jgi:hypothetical protein
MTGDRDWHLPDDYWAEHHIDGRITLWLDELQVRDFRPATPQAVIEAWAEAYATGRSAGEAHGRIVGRNLLATEFRTLLQA